MRKLFFNNLFLPLFLLSSWGLYGQSCAYFTSSVNGSIGSFVSALGSPSAYYYWSFGDGTSGYGQVATHTYSQAGQYAVCLSVYDSLTSCQGYFCDSIYISNGGGSNCDANFTASLSGMNGSFYANNPSANAQYYWSFSDGGYAYGAQANHAFNQYGYVDVCLTAWNGNCSDTLCQSFYIAPDSTGCDATFDFSVSGNNGYFYIVNPSAGTNYQWNFGDGSYGYGTQVTHSFQNQWNYVCVWAYDSLQNCSNDFCDTVMVGNGGGNCDASFYSSVQGNTAFISVANPNWGLYYNVDFGDGSYGYGPQSTHTYANPGVYNVCVWAYDSMQNACSFCDTLVINGGGTGNCDATFDFSVSGSNGYFYIVNPSAGTNYQWNFGDGSYGYGTQVTHSFQNQWNYVCVWAYDSLQNCSNDFCDTVMIGNGGGNCDANFSSFISNSVGSFYATSNTPNMNYYWSFSDGGYAYGSQAVHTFAGYGYFDVCLTAWDSLNTCSDTLCQSFYIAPDSAGCDANFFSSNFGTSAYFYASNPSFGSNYFWSFGDGTSDFGPQVLHNFPGNGIYYVCLTVIDSFNNCQNSYCQDVFVQDSTGSGCDASFFSSLFGTGGSFFAANPNQGGMYMWNFGDGTSDFGPQVYHNFPGNGLYNVCLTVVDSFNSCQNTYCENIWVMDSTGGNCDASFFMYPDSTNTGVVTFYASNPSFLANFTWMVDGNYAGSGPWMTLTQDSTDHWVCLIASDSLSGCVNDSCFLFPRMGWNVGVDKQQTYSLSAFPNPISGSELNATFTLPKAEKVRISLQNVLGATLSSESIQAESGKNTHTLSVSELSQGIYFLVIETDSHKETIRVVK